MSTEDQDEQPIAGHGVIVRAANGDVIRYDPTGLVMRLSDKVIADIALRLGHRGETDPAPRQTSPKPATAPDDLLDGIDAWAITQDGDWLRFTARLPGAQGVRGFRRHIDGGATLGDGPGAVLGILGLGGPRAALATPGAPAFPHHITAPADDIGAVGMAGIEAAPITDRLEPLREATHEALVAETILHWQIEKFAPLPLIVTRVETDASPSAADLARGHAVQNLLIAAGNLKAAATRMGKRAKLLGICLDYALEHVTGDATAYRDGMLATMRALEKGLGALGFDRPLFVARFEAGLGPATAGAVLQGQWELVWNHGDHRLIFSSPSYPFARDAYDRPTDDARRQMAEMTAALSEGESWRCPTLMLAEWEPGAPIIRVTAQSEGPLVIDGGGTAGFAVIGAEGITVETVTLAPDDPQALLVRVSKRADGLHLSYAAGTPGALRDTWSLDSRTGTPLHRWALPAILPVHEGKTGGAMLELPDRLPPARLRDANADLLAEMLTETQALWWTGADLADRTGAVTAWPDRLTARVARPTTPNTGNGLISEAGDLAGLQCRDGLHCGLVAEDVAQDAATVTLAARYLPPYGEDAKTILTFNTGGGAKKSASENYLFLSETDGSLTVKDDKGLIDLTLPAPPPDLTRLILVTLDRTRLAVEVMGGAAATAEARAPVLTGPASLFIGCRNQRPGLTKTLGGALIADVWLWPGRALLVSDDPADRTALTALRRFVLWSDEA